MDYDSEMNWIHWLFVQSFNITLRLFLLCENKLQSLLSNFYPSATPSSMNDSVMPTKFNDLAFDLFTGVEHSVIYYGTRDDELWTLDWGSKVEIKHKTKDLHFWQS